jgi:hypothetical protein
MLVAAALSMPALDLQHRRQRGQGHTQVRRLRIRIILNAGLTLERQMMRPRLRSLGVHGAKFSN